jgi:GT2 family glycosyltransferase
MTTELPELSICIVSYNTRDMLRACLESIYAQPPRIPFEIVIVDNHSTDGSVAMLAEAFPEIMVIQNSENRGYTAPMNQALQAAGATRFLVQLNPDTVILPAAFDCMVDFMAGHPEVGIISPKVLNRDGSLQRQCRRSAARPWDTLSYSLGLWKLGPATKFWNGYLKGQYGEDETHPTEAVSGSCMFIRREVIEQIGYLDENFFAYQEDSDFCFRTRKAGWQIYYVPQAKIIHYGGQGGSQVHLAQSVIAWHQSFARYYRKHLAKDYFFLFNLVFYGLIWVKLQLALLSTRSSRRNYVGTPKP